MFERRLSRRGLVGAAAMLLAAGGARAQGVEGRVVETSEGRYRGRLENGVEVFRGMRYGADTAGPGRFMPPRPPEKFAGVRDAFDFGDQAPQPRTILTTPGPISEDCLRINVWTPGASRAARWPVMLWFHGGGFEAGTGASGLYDGSNMARRGDVVVVTINHRLNVCGFCDLSDYLGAEFVQSGNVGYLDLVAAMRWVRENIAAFGGDPGNVTIYGQSGGGRKVSVCYAGAEANGLFHKGIVQSGSHLRVHTPEQARALTSALLKELDIAPADARKLQSVPHELLGATQRRVIAAAGYRFEPVIDGVSFKADPWLPNAPRQTAKVPLMLGTTQTELSNQLGRDPAIFAMDEAALKARLATTIPPEAADEAVRIFRASTPSGSTAEMFFKIASWRAYITNATTMAEQRHAQNGAANPTWVYQVTWRSPVQGGRRFSEHTIDLPFMFDNVARAPHLTGPETAQTRAMTEAMANAWLAFARKGDPNHAGLPRWPTYDVATRPVMLFDTPPTVANDPFREERLFMARFPAVRGGS
ncbi:carboxylesterase/lipase family protein [Phenylobacterium kunshanense]|uniref:Carboxylic ester hydrolase n=1 Tax=Phenylobacterium kunshanense TaxID=1445034 RepID=A0A328B637_9CAUL|nr:carboxylesterase family protein [Phenylobacterium kunshanense]RAK62862.1 carboxylesterase/lipase family protein [Phenylobacterium kunshanense]